MSICDGFRLAKDALLAMRKEISLKEAERLVLIFNKDTHSIPCRLFGPFNRGML
jgi:hypothetical protein